MGLGGRGGNCAGRECVKLCHCVQCTQGAATEHLECVRCLMATLCVVLSLGVQVQFIKEVTVLREMKRSSKKYAGALGALHDLGWQMQDHLVRATPAACPISHSFPCSLSVLPSQQCWVRAPRCRATPLSFMKP